MKRHDPQLANRLYKAQKKVGLDQMSRERGPSFVYAYNKFCKARWGSLDADQEARYMANTQAK
mgnify:CR=1 FL=1